MRVVARGSAVCCRSGVDHDVVVQSWVEILAGLREFVTLICTRLLLKNRSLISMEAPVLCHAGYDYLGCDQGTHACDLDVVKCCSDIYGQCCSQDYDYCPDFQNSLQYVLNLHAQPTFLCCCLYGGVACAVETGPQHALKVPITLYDIIQHNVGPDES